MRITYMPKMIIMMCTLAMLIACSNEEQNVEEKSEIRKATDKIAHELVEDIQQPLDKAEAIKTLEEQRNNTIRKQAE